MRRYKAVLMDVDGTLYLQQPLRLRMAVELGTSLLKNPRGGLRTFRIIRAYRRTHEVLRNKVFAQNISDIHLNRVSELTGYSRSHIESVIEEWMLRRPVLVLRRYRRRHVVGFLRACRREGIFIGVLSDYPPEDKMKALGLEQLVDLMLCSSAPEVNALKPSPQGILHACAKWNIEPRELLYIGDRAEVDGAAAASAGADFILMGKAGRFPYPTVSSFLELESILRPAG